MGGEHHGLDLLPILTLLAIAVVAAPLFKRLGLGSVLGYLAGGLVIGPFGLRVFTDPASILQIAEAGRRDVPVRDRPGDAAVAAVGDAPPDLRAGFRPGVRLRWH